MTTHTPPTPIRRYVAFAYYQYYPSGGWGDFVGSFDLEQEAIQAGLASDRDNVQVVDTYTQKVIELTNGLYSHKP